MSARPSEISVTVYKTPHLVHRRVGILTSNTTDFGHSLDGDYAFQCQIDEVVCFLVHRLPKTVVSGINGKWRCRTYWPFIFGIVVFCTRYLDIFRERYAWNLFFKLFYITSSLYIVGIMQWVYPRTREREVAWKLGAAVFGGSLAISPFVMMILENSWGFSTVCNLYIHLAGT